MGEAVNFRLQATNYPPFDKILPILEECEGKTEGASGNKSPFNPHLIKLKTQIKFMIAVTINHIPKDSP